MMSARAFTPNRDFAPPKEAAVEEADAPKLINEDEVNALIGQAAEEARQAGYKEGEEAGKAAAEATLSAALSVAVSELQTQLTDLLEKEDEVLKAVELRAVRLILSIAQKLTTDVSDAEAEKFAATVARRAVDAARGAPSVEIRVSEELLDPISAALSGPLTGSLQSGRAVIAPDPSLNRASVHVSWSDGSVTFDPGAMESAVNEIIGDALAKIQREDQSFKTQERIDGREAE